MRSEEEILKRLSSEEENEYESRMAGADTEYQCGYIAALRWVLEMRWVLEKKKVK